MSAPQGSTPEAEEITDGQIDCLSELILRPSRYTQRCVEQMAFLEDGGEKWTRTIQVRIPASPGSEKQWRPVSLGTFPRKRYPDLVVTDCTGRRMSLLTRRQHGRALAQVVLHPHLEAVRRLAPKRVLMIDRLLGRTAATNEAIVVAMSNLLTTMPPDSDEAREHARSVSRHFDAYVAGLDVAEALSQPIRFALGMRVASEQRDTRYLCWTWAAPGEVLNLTVSYTAFDVVGRRMPVSRRTPPESVEGLEHEPSQSEMPRCERWRAWWRRTRRRVALRATAAFQRFGFAPLVHNIEAPANTAANSYYFTVSPPPTTTVLALFSDVDGSHSDDGEVDSPARCFHIHNADDATSGSAVLRAYLMPERREHMTIAAGAVLNILFVWLVAHGRFVNGFSAQTWLLITPTALTGFIARQQRHYYAYATRHQRTLLWLYLLVGVVFLVVVTFSNAHIPGSEAAWGWRAKTIFVAFSTISAFIAVAYVGLGPLFPAATERIAGWLTKRAAKRTGDERKWVGVRAVFRYDCLVLAYCLVTFGVALLFAGSVCAAGIVTWVRGDVRVASRTRAAVALPELLSVPLTPSAPTGARRHH
jgi:hypothetical protein